MGFYEVNSYPCTNYQNMNLDWFLNEFLRIKDIADGVLTERLVELIDKRFNELMINAIYDSETETIILKKGVRNNG